MHRSSLTVDRPLKQLERSNKNNHLQSNRPVHPRGSHGAVVDSADLHSLHLAHVGETSLCKLTGTRGSFTNHQRTVLCPVENESAPRNRAVLHEFSLANILRS